MHSTAHSFLLYFHVQIPHTHRPAPAAILVTLVLKEVYT